MRELKAPEPKEEEVAPVSAPLRNLPRIPINAGWLRPVAAAGPVAAKLILEKVERVAASAPVRTLPATLASAPPVLLSFIGLVLVPSLAVVLYFAFFASDQFAVESKFAVRSVELEVAVLRPCRTLHLHPRPQDSLSPPRDRTPTSSRATSVAAPSLTT